jgi:hypothetical protein
MKQIQRDIIMAGSSYLTFEISSGMQFVSIVNNTDNTIQLYQDQRDFATADVRDTIAAVSSFQQQTVPLGIGNGNWFTVVWINGGGVDPKKVTLYFSDENLGMNSSLGNPAGSSSVTLQTDNIGLAKQAQLPAALSGSGNLKVDIQNSPSVTATISGTPSVSISGTPSVTATISGTPSISISGTPSVTATISGTPNVAQTSKPVNGSHANAWNNVSVGAGGASASIDTQYAQSVTIFGNASAATDISIEVSMDNTNFYSNDNGNVQDISLTGAGDFMMNLAVGARYIRLRSSGAATITATIAAKG